MTIQQGVVTCLVSCSGSHGCTNSTLCSSDFQSFIRSITLSHCYKRIATLEIPYCTDTHHPTSLCMSPLQSAPRGIYWYWYYNYMLHVWWTSILPKFCRHVGILSSDVDPRGSWKDGRIVTFVQQSELYSVASNCQEDKRPFEDD